jgi:NADPH:quinone reductase-like Zn-dependent oxidoreductase
MNGLTVQLALDLLALKPGDALAVTGAAGAVGGYAVQLGVAQGLRVIAVSATDDEPLLKQLGAGAFVPRGEEAPQRIRDIAPAGVDGVVDAAAIGSPILATIRDGGGLAAVRAFEGETERGIKIHQVRVAEYARRQGALARLGELASLGKLNLRVAETFPPERVAEAHVKLAAGGVRGRLVVVF